MSLSITIDTKEVSSFIRRWGDDAPKKIASALLEAGRVVESDAKRFCPQSPTKSQSDNYAGLSKSKYYRGKDPGTLSRSIKILNKSQIKLQQRVEVGIPRNSTANRYADYIHNRKHRDWFLLGPGSTSKGAHVDDKFLDRALDANASDIQRLFERASEEPS